MRWAIGSLDSLKFSTNLNGTSRSREVGAGELLGLRKLVRRAYSVGLELAVGKRTGSLGFPCTKLRFRFPALSRHERL